MQKSMERKKEKSPTCCDRSISMMQNSVCGGDSVDTQQSERQLHHKVTVRMTKREKAPQQSEMLISD